MNNAVDSAAGWNKNFMDPFKVFFFFSKKHVKIKPVFSGEGQTSHISMSAWPNLTKSNFVQ